MKLSVITITCRANPRLSEMARTLAASLDRAPSVDLQWIVVDEQGKDDAVATAMQSVQAMPSLNRFTAQQVPPLPSPHRYAGEKMPAHNSARMAGLLVATGDYVVFLNDCTLVTQDWVSVAADCFAKGKGWRCKTHVVSDMKVPDNGIVRMKDHHDLLRPVPPATVPGACWGAPHAAFEAIGGFDLAYDGEDKGHDLDAVLRLARIGVPFITTERAACVRLRRTKTKTEISTRKEAFNGVRNLKLLQKLNLDRDRTQPLQPAGNGVIQYAPPPTAAAPAAPAPTRTPAGRPARPVRPAPAPRATAGSARPIRRRGRGAQPAAAPAEMPPVADGGDHPGPVDTSPAVTADDPSRARTVSATIDDGDDGEAFERDHASMDSGLRDDATIASDDLGDLSSADLLE